MTELETPSTVIDLLRHGEPEGGKCFRGNGIDDPLSEDGWKQMWDAVEEQQPWQIIITSPMQRCHHFAQRFSEKHTIPVVVEPDLREVGFGSWEGKTREYLQQHHRDEYDDFYLDPINNRPEGAEPFNEFVTRVAGVYKRVTDSFEGKHVLVVAHAGVIRAVLMHALKEDPVAVYQTQIENAKISRLRQQSQRVIAEFINSSL